VKAGSIFSNFLLTDEWDTAKTQIDAINVVREAEKKLKEKADAEASAAAAEQAKDSEKEEPVADEDKEDL